MNPDEQFLDGYRHGLGEAIRHVERIRHTACHPSICHALDRAAADITAAEIVEATLRGLATGLRLLSASARLADKENP